uniref:(California timema) hypothetical protein n=1 Tax=Timema californicum TaxID=61474 RepID=A0A7R9J4K4_TIMCA|nr:unnamed protein product [Timema californicum]
MEEASDLMGTGRELPANPTDDPEESEVFQDLDEDHEFTPPDTTFFSNLSQENSIKHSTPIKASDETSLAKMPPDDEDNLPTRDKEKHLTGERTRGQKATTQKSYTKKATTRNATTRKDTTRKATTQMKEKQKEEKRSVAKLPDDEESDDDGSDSSDETSLSEDEGDDSTKRKRGPCPQRMKEISIPTKKEVERLTQGLPRPKYIKQSAKRIRTEMYCKKWLTKQCDDIALKLVKLGKTRTQVERSDEVRFLTECIIMNMGKLRPRPGKRSLPKVKKMRRNFAEKIAAVLLEMAKNADEFAEEEEKEMRRRRKKRKERRRRKKESKGEERERSRRDEMKKDNSEEERKHKSGVDEKDESGKDDDNDDRRGSGGDHDKKSEDNKSIRQSLGEEPRQLEPPTLKEEPGPQEPSRDPSQEPSRDSSRKPSRDPSREPSRGSTQEPSLDPSREPSRDSTREPSHDPSQEPSHDPSQEPSHDPTQEPSHDPTQEPSHNPTREPSRDPSQEHKRDPLQEPSRDSSHALSREHSNDSSVGSSLEPSRKPSIDPSSDPLLEPGDQLSSQEQEHVVAKEPSLEQIEPAESEKVLIHSTKGAGQLYYIQEMGEVFKVRALPGKVQWHGSPSLPKVDFILKQVAEYLDNLGDKPFDTKNNRVSKEVSSKLTERVKEKGMIVDAQLIDSVSQGIATWLEEVIQEVEHLEKADKLLKVKERGAGQEWSYGKADVIAPLGVLQWADYIHDSYSMAEEWAKCLSHTVQEAENMARIKNGDIVGNDGKVKKLTKKQWQGWQQDVNSKLEEFLRKKQDISLSGALWLSRTLGKKVTE